MPRGGVQLKVKNSFFDKAAVLKAIGGDAAKALSKFGAFVWKRARTSMRRRKKSAAAGSPPSAHAGQLKTLLFFSWDPSTRSVVIGPTPFREGKVPSLLEFGGSTTLRKRGGHSKTARYAAFPFMGPALEAEAPNMPKAWAAAVKR